MSTPPRFPGYIYGLEMDPITPGAPRLDQDGLDAIPHRSLICDDDTSDVSLILVMDKGARFGMLPPFFLDMILRELRRRGKSVMVLSIDPEAEESVRDGLIDRLSLEDTPAPWMGQA